MLKSIDFINRLESDLDENIKFNNINKYYIELRINQNINVYIVSDQIKKISNLVFKSVLLEEIDNCNINYNFLTEKESK